VLHTFGSDAEVTREGTVDETEIKNILNVDCTSLTSEDQDECNKLENNLASYISAQNQYGTARPLGGTSMLRSYRESRFRGAHSRFYGSELRFNFVEIFGSNILQFAIFAESGNVADKLSEISTNTRTSYGGGIRFIIDKLIVRLDSANGDEGGEWSLMVGNPW
jgi:hypothetical protein